MNDKHIDKFLSARFLMAVGFSFTYCLVIIASIILAITGKLSIEVFLALLTGFSSTMLYIVKSYFERNDRKENGNASNNN